MNKLSSPYIDTELYSRTAKVFYGLDQIEKNVTDMLYKQNEFRPEDIYIDGEIYLHGKQQIWDYAAGDLILEEAGGFASTLYGNPSFRYTLEPRSSCAAIDEALFQVWQNYLLDAVNG